MGALAIRSYMFDDEALIKQVHRLLFALGTHVLPPGAPLVALVLLAVATLRRLSVPGDEMRTFPKTGFRVPAILAICHRRHSDFD